MLWLTRARRLNGLSPDRPLALALGLCVLLLVIQSLNSHGAAIDSHVLGVVLRSAPQLEEMLRVVETLGPSPSQPVVVRSGLDSEVKARIRDRLLELHDPLMNEFLVDGFAPAPDYSLIASVVSAATNGWR